ncbi:39736_t:CDS:1, partial [Gigaspora margarita]
MGNSVKNGNILLQFNQPYGCYWYDNSISKFAPIRNASTHQNLLIKDCN